MPMKVRNKSSKGTAVVIFNLFLPSPSRVCTCRTVFKVKPFPDNIPITIATYKEQPNMEPALAKVKCVWNL